MFFNQKIPLEIGTYESS